MLNTTYSSGSIEPSKYEFATAVRVVRHLAIGTSTKPLMDDSLPNGPHQRTIEYIAPFFCPDREEDYRVAWEFFEAQANTPCPPQHHIPNSTVGWISLRIHHRVKTVDTFHLSTLPRIATTITTTSGQQSPGDRDV